MAIQNGLMFVNVGDRVRINTIYGTPKYGNVTAVLDDVVAVGVLLFDKTFGKLVDGPKDVIDAWEIDEDDDFTSTAVLRDRRAEQLSDVNWYAMPTELVDQVCAMVNVVAAAEAMIAGRIKNSKVKK